MTRPDFERMRRESQTIIGGAGESMTWRKWVSAAGGANQYGLQTQNFYTEFQTTGLLKQYDPRLKSFAGGQSQEGTLYVTLPFEMGARDELIYAGSAFRVDGNADRETFGAGRVLFNHSLRLANITG